MATFDYDDILATVAELLAEFGDPVTFVRYNTTPADSAEPWNGPTDARTGGNSATAVANAVAVPPSDAAELGIQITDAELFKRTTAVLIVEPGTAAPEDLDTYNELTYRGKRMRSELIDVLKPAQTEPTLLYFFAVVR